MVIRHRSCIDVVLLKIDGEGAAGIDLSGAYLRGAQLSDVNCAGSSLQGAYLRQADLRGADLRGADLRGADLEAAELERARYDSGTLWPVGFRPDHAGALLSVDLFQNADGLHMERPDGEARLQALVLERGVRLVEWRGAPRLHRDGVSRGKDLRAALRAGWCWLWDDHLTSGRSAGGKGCELDMRDRVLCLSCGQWREIDWSSCWGCLQARWRHSDAELRRSRAAQERSAQLSSVSRALVSTARALRAAGRGRPAVTPQPASSSG